MGIYQKYFSVLETGFKDSRKNNPNIFLFAIQSDVTLASISDEIRANFDEIIRDFVPILL